jgi:hypothetical protein
MSSSQARVAGRYRLLDQLGSGGMGIVWRARDEVLGREVAVKEVIPPAGLTRAEREELRLRTMREARAAARLNNPHVVRTYDVVYARRRPWIVMEYVPSRSLHGIIAENGPLAPDRVAQIGLAVLAALTAAHQAGVLHRDVKPGNVLLADDGRVVLTDFGAATFEGGGESLTRPGLIVGSAEYLSPERARDGTCGPEADLWALGATLYAALEGRSPYARSTTFATLTALATEDPDPPRRAGPLEPVLNALLRKDPQDRAGVTTAERLLRQAATGVGGNGTVAGPGPDPAVELAPVAGVGSPTPVAGVGSPTPVAGVGSPPPVAFPGEVAGRTVGLAGRAAPPASWPAGGTGPLSRGPRRRWLVTATAVIALVVVAMLLSELMPRASRGSGAGSRTLANISAPGAGSAPTATPGPSQPASGIPGASSPDVKRSARPHPTVTSTAPTSRPASGRDAHATIRAESYNQQSGVTLEPTGDTGGGHDVTSIGNRDWVLYRNVEFGATPASQLYLRVASGAGAGISGLVEVRLDSIGSTPIGSCSVDSTGGWQSWRTVPANISAVTGTHHVYLTFTSTQPADWMSMNWLTFGP